MEYVVYDEFRLGSHDDVWSYPVQLRMQPFLPLGPSDPKC